MARLSNSMWDRYKYKVNGLVLILSCFFLYKNLFPQFPDAWSTKSIGSFEVTPMPYNLDSPYMHDGTYTKDFLLIFSQGEVADIRQAYFNIGAAPLSLTDMQDADAGILHGSQHGQEVHAIAPKVIQADHRAWLTIENWQGKLKTVSWAIPKNLHQ
ncbi:hypothetical protein [Shewanella sp. WPAGA9]|uniref:hypothetical protein n=1 Tax=Shewanella sp. ENK2 TaxID=2775245 RepID=UPI0017864A7F|nr:hypothetical protein [Shewanella sp. WPAGA9]